MQELHLHRLCEDVRLEELSEAAVAIYLSERLPDHRLSAAVARLIHERTGGNPLFMNDLVDDLVRQGSIVRTEGQWRLGSAIEEVAPGCRRACGT